MAAAFARMGASFMGPGGLGDRMKDDIGANMFTGVAENIIGGVGGFLDRVGDKLNIDGMFDGDGNPFKDNPNKRPGASYVEYDDDGIEDVTPPRKRPTGIGGILAGPQQLAGAAAGCGCGNKTAKSTKKSEYTCAEKEAYREMCAPVWKCMRKSKKDKSTPKPQDSCGKGPKRRGEGFIGPRQIAGFKNKKEGMEWRQFQNGTQGWAWPLKK